MLALGLQILWCLMGLEGWGHHSASGDMPLAVLCLCSLQVYLVLASLGIGKAVKGIL